MQVNLEVLHYAPTAPAKVGPPLLFIHGAFMSAQCWERHFLPWFSQRGYDCWAFSFRGHGSSSGREFLSLASLDHYRQDLDQAVAQLPATPILIAHGMGGLVVHRWLHEHRAPAVALLGSVPPAGSVCSMMQLAMTDPQALCALNQLQNSQQSGLDLAKMKKLLFSPATPETWIDDCLPLFQAESQRALVDISVMHFEPLPADKRPRVLILGGELDSLLPHHLVHAAAAHCGVQGQTVPGIGHALMLEPDWEQVAQRLADWLTQP